MVANKQLEERHWFLYQALLLDNPEVQKVSYSELIANTPQGVDWASLPDPAIVKTAATDEEEELGLTDCEVAIGFVIFDVICLAVGGVALRDGLKPKTAEAMAKAAKPVLSKLEATIAKIAAEGASLSDQAWGVFEILKMIWSGGCLGAVLSAFLGSLTWYYALLYGATAMATIVAALATDGIAFVAEITVLLATFGFLVADSINAVESCK